MFFWHHRAILLKLSSEGLASQVTMSFATDILNVHVINCRKLLKRQRKIEFMFGRVRFSFFAMFLALSAA